MKDYYIESAKEISKIVDECSEDYELSNILKAGMLQIMKLSKENGMLIKVASVDDIK